MENPLAEEADHWSCLKQIQGSYLKPAAVDPFQKLNSRRDDHPWGVQTHLPFQVQHPHPPRCNDAYHLR